MADVYSLTIYFPTEAEKEAFVMPLRAQPVKEAPAPVKKPVKKK